MKHICNKTVLSILTTIALLLSGCTTELYNEGIGEGSYLSLSIDGLQTPTTVARQGASTRAVNESAVNDLWILQFQMSEGSTTEGTLVKKTYINNANDLSDPTKIKYNPQEGSNMMLYLVANTGNSSQFTAIPNGTPFANIKKSTVSVTANTSTSLPMVGQSASNLTLPTAVPVTLTRIVAKVILTVKNKLTTGYPQLTVTSTQLKNATSIYSTQIVNSASGFTGTTYYPPISTAYFSDNAAVSGNITDAGTTTTYYVAPNVRGIGTATDDRLKGPDTAPSGQGAYCTYVEILGTAKATATSPAVDVRYRLYLGGNNTNDFNLYSNTAYKVGVELMGLSAADARLTITTDKFDLVQGGFDGDHEDNIAGWTPLKIGDLKDGGIVYEVSGDTYKLFSLVEGENSLQWSLSQSYMLGSAGQSATDGAANVAAMKKYATENGLTFSTDFPAAGFCDKMNTGGVTGWYLPAVDELKAFVAKYKLNKVLLDNVLSTNGETPFPNTSFGLLSSTESSSDLQYTSFVEFVSEMSFNVLKHHSGSNVRCIKNSGATRTYMFYGDAANNGDIITDLQGSTTSSYNSFVVGSNGSTFGSAINAFIAEKVYYKLEVAGSNELNPATNKEVMTWESAMNICKAKTTDGGGWRLPRISEMWLIFLNQTSLEATLGFSELPDNVNYWSATECNDLNISAWAVDFINSTPKNRTKSDEAYYVRCVREL